MTRTEIIQACVFGGGLAACRIAFPQTFSLLVLASMVAIARWVFCAVGSDER